MKSTRWKRRLFSGSLLYVILDEAIIAKAKKDIFYLADKLCRQGIDFLQFRFSSIPDKKALDCAKNLCRIIHRQKKILIINNRIDLCRLSGADGVHLGANDISVPEARRILGQGAIIGKTAHSLKELKDFQKEGVDYLSVGPAFKTKIKPQLKPLGLAKIKTMIKIAKKPLFVIGAITLDNARDLLILGARNLALCRTVILSKNIKNTIKSLKECFNEA